MKEVKVAGARIVGTREGAVNVYGLPASIALTLAGVAEYAARQAFEDDAALARLADALEQAAGYAEDPPPAWTAVYRSDDEWDEEYDEPGEEVLDSEQEALERLRWAGPDGTELLRRYAAGERGLETELERRLAEVRPAVPRRRKGRRR